jgi:hypothetical protein
MNELINFIESGILKFRHEFPPQLWEYFQFCEHLYTIVGVILIKLISSFILLSLAVVVRTLFHVTDLTASESSKDTADMMILFSMSVTSDSESEVCMPDKNDVAGSNDIVSFLMAAM